MCVCWCMVPVWGERLLTRLCVCASMFFYLSVCNDAWIVQLYSIDRTPVNSNCRAWQCVLWDLRVNTLAFLSICSDLQEKQAMLPALSAYPVWSRHTLFPYGSTAWLVLAMAGPANACLTCHCVDWCDAMLNRPICSRPSWHRRELVQRRPWRERNGAMHLVLSKVWIPNVFWIVLFKEIQVGWRISGWDFAH